MKKHLAEEPRSSKTQNKFIISRANAVGIIFLVLGIVILLSSVYLTSQILAFIGLGITFWGALFLLIAPSKYVEGRLMANTQTPFYLNIDRIVREFQYKGKAFHIPPYPEGVQVPDHLKGLKGMVVFVSATQENTVTPSIEEIAKGKFILESPKGILIIPPGLGLLDQIERKLKTDLTKTSVIDLCEIMPRSMMENFSLAKDIIMATEENQIDLKVADSVYEGLYSVEKDLKSVNLLGCPIVSSIACALAKSSGKPVSIKKLEYSSTSSTMEAQYELLQG